MSNVRALALTGLLIAAALMGWSKPAAAGSSYAMTVSITRVQVVDAMDEGACGEFKHFSVLPVRPGSPALWANRVAVMPNKILNGFETTKGGQIRAVRLCPGGDHTVSKVGYGPLLDEWAKFSADDLFRDPVTAPSDVNVAQINGFPGAPLALITSVTEIDFFGTYLSNQPNSVIPTGLPGETVEFKVPITFGSGADSKVSMYIWGKVTTSTQPAGGNGGK